MSFSKDLILQKATEVFIETLRQSNCVAFFHPNHGIDKGTEYLSKAYISFVKEVYNQLSGKITDTPTSK